MVQAMKLKAKEQPSFAILLGSPGDEEIIIDGMQAARSLLEYS